MLAGHLKGRVHGYSIAFEIRGVFTSVDFGSNKLLSFLKHASEKARSSRHQKICWHEANNEDSKEHVWDFPVLITSYMPHYHILDTVLFAKTIGLHIK